MGKRAARRARTVLEGARVVTASGERRADVSLRDGLVERVGRAGSERGDRVVGLDGLFLAPGLIDCHTHFVLDGDADPLAITRRSDAALAIRGVGLAAATLAGGVTAVRDNGSRNFVNLELRDAINRGWIPGPRTFAAGEWLTMTGGHGHFMGHEIDGVDEARKAARLQMKRGADCIKVMATGGVMTPGVNHRATQLVVEELAVIVEEAARAGRTVSAHAHGAEGIKNAVEAGCASVEHGTFMDEEAARMMAKAGVFWVPTMKALDDMRTKGEEHGLPDYVVRKAREAEEAIGDAWRFARKHGVRVAMGTDAGTPFNHHGENAREVELYVACGLTPREALASATEAAASLLGKAGELGAIAPGAHADLLVLRRSPLKEPKALARARVAVLKGGGVVAGRLPGRAG
ncbi:MAG TPA: amidohydrolase family protein [Candidatus Thermoplasmatota archaeon]